MATEAIYIEKMTVSGVRSFSIWQKLMLRRFHPRVILLDVVAMTWLTYFVWQQQWRPAVLVVLAARLLSFISVKELNYARMAETTWGKLALLHLHPANYVIQLAAVVFLLVGLWNHDTLTILASLSALFLGHWFGWSKICEGWGE